jgi:hypothetical protein
VKLAFIFQNHRFILLVMVLCGMGMYVVGNYIKQWSMSDDQVKQRMQEQDMVEMRELMNEREYLEEAGKILLPAGY